MTGKMRQYLDCEVTTGTGRVFSNPLMLSEVNLVSRLAAENEKVLVRRQEVSEERYKSMFGIR